MRALLLVPLLGVLLAGCGHPATREECDEIVNRTAEIELREQAITDPKVIAERMASPGSVERMKKAVDQCVGTRITETALRCVRASTTAKQMDRCLD